MAVLAACLLAAASAGAVTRHVAPGGGAGFCLTPQTACDIATGFAVAIAGDDISIAPGDYSVGGTLNVNAGVLSVHGVDGQSRPVIHGSFAGPVVNSDVTASFHRLAIRQDANSSVALRAAPLPPAPVTLTDLFVHAQGSDGTAVQVSGDVTMSNSVAWGAGAPGDGVLVTDNGVTGPQLRNVTAFGNGAGGAAIEVADGKSVGATNTIARAAGGAVDLFTAGNANFNLTNSNFASQSAGVTVNGPGNQGGAPLLANPGGGDFHQLPGSPTINAGLVDPLAGALDFDGEPRLLGLLPDIGADEYLPRPPAVITDAATGISSSGATLTGTVNPNGVPTSYRFEYGPTTAYGSSTALQDAGAGTSPVAVSAVLAGLAPGSLIHYRLVAVSADGETTGLDRLLVVLGNPAGAGDVPRFTGLTLPPVVTVGEEVTLEASGLDPDAPINSITVDFGDGPEHLAMSACRIRPPDPVFQGNRESSFSVPHTFTEPGVHTLEVTLGSGDCGRARQASTQTIQVNVVAAKTRVAREVARLRGDVTRAAAACRGAGRVTGRRNRKLIARATVCVLNKVRRQSGRRALRSNRKLRKAAALHNGYMARKRTLSHQVPGEPPLQRRLRLVRYRGAGGENIGVGAGQPWGTARGMMVAWMNSPVHRANILEPRYRKIGVAVMAQKPYDPTRPGATFTTEFGIR
jgi:uncharacterized protein YkwD